MPQVLKYPDVFEEKVKPEWSKVYNCNYCYAKNLVKHEDIGKKYKTKYERFLIFNF